MSYEHYYVVIIGSGPAGLGVANTIIDNDFLASRTLILEKGPALEERTCPVRTNRPCKSCDPCNIISGIGGAGPFTDGKICLFPQRLPEFFPEWREDGENKLIDESIIQYLERVKNIWTDFGANDFKAIKADSDKMSSLKAEALKESINFKSYPVLHIGSDGATEVIKNFIKDIENAGIKIYSNSNVTHINKINNDFLITYSQIVENERIEKKITASFLILALGRDMQKVTHIKELFENVNITFQPKNLEIGCRVEIPYQIIEDIIDVTYDPKFKVITPTYDDEVRTFCICHRGRIVREHTNVNGHVNKHSLTNNSNFALIVRWPLDSLILEDAMDYGNTIAKLVLAQGKGKPIVQRLGDFKKGIPSTDENIKKSYIKSTLRRNWNVTPGDITSCYPGRIVTDIIEGIDKLNKVIKGVSSDQTLLYAPEIKPTCIVNLKNGVKTEEKNLYICGDFSGYTRGISQAMIMGMMVGEDILNEVEKGFQLKII